ncbi:dorsal-ventral patterning protein tolloid-like [Microplitis mediator]|uniref:dorsal-ventral patterning protein tolloid-like n=1 Tax=Microplitis mediator TaxID=375433 RepID=UPI00255723E7|nr:dorsal-ventral patterning protein tolloid-like [Microplitis mediator]
MEYISYIFLLKICFSIIFRLDSYVLPGSIGQLEVFDHISEFGKNQTTNKQRRSHAVNKKDRLWDGGIIPYEIDKVFTLAQYQLIKQAMQLWERSTCIQFVPRIKGVHKDYTIITKEYCGCCSVVGKNSDEKQFISLHDNCMDRYTLLHELGHTIGLYHEHMRSDRDEYVNIFRANIASGTYRVTDAIRAYPEKNTLEKA